MRAISPAAGAARAQAGGTARAVGAGLAGTGICVALALALASVPAAATTRSPAETAATAATGPAGATGATVPVIVFLKKQPAAEGGARVRSDQRFALVQAAQAPYLNQLSRLGAADVHRYALVDAIAARVPSSAVAALTDSPGVAAVIPDSPIVGPAAATDAPAADAPAADAPTAIAHGVGAPARLRAATHAFSHADSDRRRRRTSSGCASMRSSSRR